MKKILFLAIAAFSLQQTIAQVKIDRSQKPKAGPAPVVSIADPVIFTLPNGITILVVENHKLPRVRANFYIDAGPVTEGKKAGMLQLMGEMLEEGTTNKPKAVFDQEVDIIGATVNLSSTGGSAAALTRYFDKAFSLMADALKNPAFPQASLDKIKSQTITNLKSNDKNAKAISTRVVNALNYGKETAMGEFITEESVKGITLDDIKNAYKNYITPSRSYLTFIGDIKPEAAKAMAIKALGSWTGKKLPVPAVPDAQNPAKTEINFVDVPTAVQGELSVTNLLTNTMNNPDYFALLLANQILGGGAESKLFMNLREKHGFTYGSYSNVGKGRFQTTFKATAAVRSDKADSAVVEMINEINSMREGKITQDDLETAKAKYNGAFALDMEDPANIATYATNILINGRPKDFYKKFLQKINEVNTSDVQRVAEKYFAVDKGRVIIVGNGDKILPNLVRLGYPIKKFDKFANPIIDKESDVNVKETPKTTESVSAFSIIENYLQAIGGKEELKKVNTIKSESEIQISGREFTGMSKRMAPNKQANDMKMGEMVVIQSVFNGKTGYKTQMGNKKDMDAEDIKQYSDIKGPIPHLYFNTADFKTDYLGTGKAGNEDAYKLKVTKPTGSVSIQYYSMKSGLLLKEENTVKQKDTEVSEIVEYSDYKKVGNVSFPFTINRTVGEQDINVHVKDIKINEGVTDADFQ